MSTADKLDRLRTMREEARQGGGAKRVEGQHARGKLSARERLELLLDEESFTEIDAFVTHRATDFGLDDERYLGDGVITGYKVQGFGRPFLVTDSSSLIVTGDTPDSYYVLESGRITGSGAGGAAALDEVRAAMAV